MFGGNKATDLLPFIQARIDAGESVEEAHVEPEICIAADYLVRFYTQLNEWRTSNGFGPAPLSLPDILAYCSINEFVINSFELRCIKILDVAFLANFKTGT